jgi:hypothetical protein
LINPKLVGNLAVSTRVERLELNVRALSRDFSHHRLQLITRRTARHKHNDDNRALADFLVKILIGEYQGVASAMQAQMYS